MLPLADGLVGRVCSIERRRLGGRGMSGFSSCVFVFSVSLIILQLLCILDSFHHPGAGERCCEGKDAARSRELAYQSKSYAPEPPELPCADALTSPPPVTW